MRKLTSTTNNSLLSGITAVLTLSTIALDSRTGLPKVHYATALDWFIICSFLYCMASLLEFAGVHYFTKVGSGEVFSIPLEENCHPGRHWEEAECSSTRSPSITKDITAISAFNHVYNVKDFSFSLEQQNRSCPAHNNMAGLRRVSDARY